MTGRQEDAVQASIFVPRLSYHTPPFKTKRLGLGRSLVGLDHFPRGLIYLILIGEIIGDRIPARGQKPISIRARQTEKTTHGKESEGQEKPIPPAFASRAHHTMTNSTIATHFYHSPFFCGALRKSTSPQQIQATRHKSI